MEYVNEFDGNEFTNENDGEFSARHFSTDGIEINENALTCRPMVVGELKEAFYNLDRAFEVYHSLDKESLAKLWPALAMALDSACNACYELGFECAEEVSETEYYYWFVRPGEK